MGEPELGSNAGLNLPEHVDVVVTWKFEPAAAADFVLRM